MPFPCLLESKWTEKISNPNLYFLPVKAQENLAACGPQFLHYRVSLAQGGSNWLDGVLAGLATLLAQQACLSRPRVAALLGRSAASSTAAMSPSKPSEKLGMAAAVVPGELQEFRASGH